MNREHVVTQLVAAFAGVRRDPSQSLHQAQLVDRGMSSVPATATEFRSARGQDTETEWTEVSPAALEECDAALSHLVPASWRFYLPAFLRQALLLFAEPGFDGRLLERVLFHLTLPPEPPFLRTHMLERFQTLSHAQSRSDSRCARLSGFGSAGSVTRR